MIYILERSPKHTIDEKITILENYYIREFGRLIVNELILVERQHIKNENILQKKITEYLSKRNISLGYTTAFIKRLTVHIYDNAGRLGVRKYLDNSRKDTSLDEF